MSLSNFLNPNYEFKINVSSLLLVFSTFLLIPTLQGFLSFEQIIFSILILFIFFLTGYVLLSFTIFRQIDNTLCTSLSIILGAFIFFISKFFIVVVFGVLIYLAIRKKIKITRTLKIRSIAIIIPGALLLFITDKEQTFSNEAIAFVNGTPDKYYFTAIVASIKYFNSIFNSNYAYGTPISYQSMSFIPPGIFARFTGISSHITLWGIWIPFYKVFGIAFIAYAINYYTGTIKKSFWLLLSGLLMILLAPINPKSLINFSGGNFIWNGHAYIIPGGNPPFILGFIWVGIILILLFHLDKEDKKVWLESLLYIFFLSSLIIVKVALFPSIFLFCFLFSFRKIMNGEMKFLIIYIATFLIAVLWYYIFIGMNEGFISIAINHRILYRKFNKQL